MFSSLIHFERTSIKVNVARLSMRFSCYSSWWFHCFLVHSGQCPTSVRVAKVSQSVTQSGYFTHLSPTSGHSHYFRIKCSLPEKRLQKILVSGNYNFWRRISKSAHEFASTKQVIIQDWLGLFIEVHPILMLRQFRMFRTKLAKSFDLSVQARRLLCFLPSILQVRISSPPKKVLALRWHDEKCAERGEKVESKNRKCDAVFFSKAARASAKKVSNWLIPALRSRIPSVFLATRSLIPFIYLSLCSMSLSQTKKISVPCNDRVKHGASFGG